MSFSEMLKILKEENDGKIVFINAGAFYIAIEEDAVLLNNKLKLKCSCFQKNTCKVGVPLGSIDTYLEKIRKIEYSYVVYNLNKEKEELQIIRKFSGKKNKITRKNINCLRCKGIYKYEDDKYMEALKKLYEKRKQ